MQIQAPVKIKVQNITGSPQVIRIPGDEIVLGAKEVAFLPERFCKTLDERIFRIVKDKPRR